MNRVRVLVEGQTEQNFVRDILKPYFDTRGIFLHAVMFNRTGGIIGYTKAKKVILRSLKEDSGIICTTMVDFYGMPADWPGRSQSKDLTRYLEKAFTVEVSLFNDIKESFDDSFNSKRFLPYVQMHEFEALLFSSPEKLAQSLGNESLTASFLEIRKKYQSPEEINDNHDSCPSRRITGIFQDFRKTMNGISAANHIGLEMMRQECPHFNEWIEKLERIGK
ncbi:MAG: DUF4276 family protein [Sedimentisphaerales bacterium]|nr:DUF4276 family protein [Sedimentisphaerales bacterium]